MLNLILGTQFRFKAFGYDGANCLFFFQPTNWIMFTQQANFFF